MIHLTKWLFVVTALLSGCATTAFPPLPFPIKEASPVPKNAEAAFIPVVRYGRYTFVKLASDAALPIVPYILLRLVDYGQMQQHKSTWQSGLLKVTRKCKHYVVSSVISRVKSIRCCEIRIDISTVLK